MNNLLLLKFILVFTATGMSKFTWAQKRDSAPIKYDSAREEEIAQRAKRRIYPGGKDESELKVQPALTKPTRKINPSVDESQDRETEHD